MAMTLKAPFPYFGGKAKVAKEVWGALGEVTQYIEPFFGSGSVLLSRPDWKPGAWEIVNDADGFIANVWRSIQFSPDEVARWCDWPVNHADLIARKKELIKNEARLLENLCNDPVWHDPILAGYWVWAASCWIGAGLTRPQASPELTCSKGVQSGKRPRLDSSMGIHTANRHVYEWMQELSARLRDVKVVCGDWTRVCGGNWQTHHGVCGIFFDPPYSHLAQRDKGIYDKDSSDIALDVAKWAAERGESNLYRIVLAGYYEEHTWLLDKGWTCHRWVAEGGYGNMGKSNNKNRFREALFFSPHCITQEKLL